MKLSTIRHVFAKDGIELLRDRRTIFVNIGLPVLLYPVIALFALQVLQLTKPTAEDAPAIAMVAAPESLRQLVEQHAQTQGDEESAGETADETKAEDDDFPYAYRLKELSDSSLETLAPALDKLSAAEQQDDENSGEPSDAVSELRREVLEQMRRANIAVLVHVVTTGPPDEPGYTIHILNDQAHRHAMQASSAVRRLLRNFEDALVADRLRERDLPPALISPLTTTTSGIAPAPEAFRSRLAGVVPVLLVLMALSGAFYPALDLIAGERERGTLESLLSWPGNRRDIFLGKLLVVIAAALVSVLLNLASLGLTMLIAGKTSGLAGDSIATMASGLSLGAGVLALSFLALLPLVIMLSAVSLAIAGLAASYKEAQNYLSPLFIVVMVPAMVCLAPGAKPGFVLDLVPIVGPLLALKESMQTSSMPWGHLLLAFGASTALAAVVVGWSVRLLEQERFLYPGLVRAGWGRFRKWGLGDPAPGGLESLAVFAVALGLFLFVSPVFQPFGALPMVMLPLIACIGLPPLIHAWLGAYTPAIALHWQAPVSRDWWLRSALLIPIAIALSLAIGNLQSLVVGPVPDVELAKLQEPLQAIMDLGGLPLLILAVAITPGICEELLCRGTLLSGLRRSLGPVGAVLVSAFCFAAIHGSPHRFLSQMGMGVVLGLLVLRSGSLWPAILLHAGHNALLVILDAHVGVGQISTGLALAQLACASFGCALLLRTPRFGISAGLKPPAG